MYKLNFNNLLTYLLRPVMHTLRHIMHTLYEANCQIHNIYNAYCGTADIFIYRRNKNKH